MVLVERGALDDAIALFRSRPVHGAECLAACRALASGLVAAARDSEADKFLEIAARMKPRLSWASLLRSRIAARAGDLQAAFDEVRQAYLLDPADVDVAEAYFDALHNAGRSSEVGALQIEHTAHREYAMDRLKRWVEPEEPFNARTTGTQMYLDLLERSVSNWIYADARNQLGTLLPFDEQARLQGRDIPEVAHTMIGLKRLRHLRVLAEQCLSDGVDGDFVETGVWRGGACILLAGVLKVHGDSSRHVVAADSFEGLPPPDPRYAKDALSTFDFHLRPELSVTLEAVQSNFARYDLLSDRVVFLKGFFRDTLPNYPLGAIAILRLDGDLYSSTMDALVHLYDRVSPGGFIIIDDYGVVIDARRATLDFRAARGIDAPMFAVDGDAVYWQKGCDSAWEAAA